MALLGAHKRDTQGTSTQGTGLRPHLSPLDTWALSLGGAVGWGAFVMPGSTLLPLAGPVGTLSAMGMGALTMFVIARCFGYVGARIADAGGAYAFTKELLGYDHAFLCAWSLGLAYIAIIWANATSVVLLARSLLGPVFQVGYCYQVAGYDVYLGEMVVTYAVLVLFGVLACLPGRVTRLLNTALACVLVTGTLGCFALVCAGGGLGASSFSPPFSHDDNILLGMFDVIALAPWAFIGFESATHAAEELTFSPRRLGGVMAAALASGLCVYLAMAALSVASIPEQFATWKDYFAALPQLSGIDALPVFNAVEAAGGRPGLALLGATVFSAIATSLLSLYRAVSRLVFRMAADGVFPERYAALDDDGTPRNAIMLAVGVSTFVPLVGRAAIGWIVDVTSVSASIAYFYVSLCARTVAREASDRRMVATATAGIAIAAMFFVFPLVPNFWSVNALATESYFILAAWAMLGLLLFWMAFRADDRMRFGKSTVVWISLLFLIFFASSLWVRQATDAASATLVTQLDEFHAQQHVEHGVPLSETEAAQEDAFVVQATDNMRYELLNNSMVQMALIAFSLGVMFMIYSLMIRRQTELEARRIAAEETSHAKTMFLSNVSHDLRTPMNAIVGYTRQAQDEGNTPEETRAYLAKIDAASAYMVALVNDVLEMGRMESGHLVLRPIEVDLLVLADDVRTLFAGQMAEKGIAFAVDVSDVQHRLVIADKDRLNSICLNLVSNAYKFTPAGGSVRVTLCELAGPVDGRCAFELRVSDTGSGMSQEFAERLYEPFEREQATESSAQGTGLGMSITKGVVEVMGGTIEVETALGVGTTFTVVLPLELSGDGIAREPDNVASSAGKEEPGRQELAVPSFEGRRVLLVDDNEINRDVASFVLEDLGLEVSVATNGAEALDAVATSAPGTYAAVLMDVRMPVMDGYEATRAIRSLSDEALARTPVIAVTANTFEEDREAGRAAGMDAFIAKPLDVDEVSRVLLTHLT